MKRWYDDWNNNILTEIKRTNEILSNLVLGGLKRG